MQDLTLAPRWIQQIRFFGEDWKVNAINAEDANMAASPRSRNLLNAMSAITVRSRSRMPGPRGAELDPDAAGVAVRDQRYCISPPRIGAVSTGPCALGSSW